MDRIRTGSHELDGILGGGFPARSIHILMGPPGSGKTILAERLAFANAAPGAPVLYLTTLSEPQPKFIAFLQEYAFADPARIGADVLYESIAESVAAEPEAIGQRVEALIREHRPRIIVVDSLKAISDLMPSLPAWRRALYDIAGLLTAYDATSFWIGEYTASMISTLPEFAVADGILELSREQHGTSDDRYLRVVKLRGSSFLDGYHAFRVTTAGLEVFPRLVSPVATPRYVSSTERLSSGIRGLDGMIAAGWLRGTSTLVAGPSGAGKTVIALHFLREGVARGEPTLLVNFQESPTQLARLMSSFGWDPQELVGEGRLDVLYTSPVEMQIDTILGEAFRRIDAHRVRRVVIDAVGDLALNARDSVRLRDYLYALTQRFACDGITGMLLLETAGPTTAGEVRDNRISYMTDNILLLGLVLGDDLARTVRVIKSRASAHDGRSHRLVIGRDGAAVGE